MEMLKSGPNYRNCLSLLELLSDEVVGTGRTVHLYLHTESGVAITWMYDT